MPKVNLNNLEDLKDRGYPKIQKINKKKPTKDEGTPINKKVRTIRDKHAKH